MTGSSERKDQEIDKWQDGQAGLRVQQPMRKRLKEGDPAWVSCASYGPAVQGPGWTQIHPRLGLYRLAQERAGPVELKCGDSSGQDRGLGDPTG